MRVSIGGPSAVDLFDLFEDAPSVERIQPPKKRRGKLVAAFGHSTALKCSPDLARKVAGLAH